MVMTLAHMIANAPGGAERLRQLASVPFTPHAERVALIEQAASFEGLAKFAAGYLKPAPSEDIARAMLIEIVPLFDSRMAKMAKALRTPGQHMKEHGLRAAVKAVRAKS
jgi:hypothetical protein